jgi:plasmid stabilization system protein ParE
MRHVQWSDDALSDVEQQVVHMAKDNPAAARRIAQRIRETGNGLGDFATGHPGRVGGTYEKSVARLPYILAYVVSEEDATITILRVVHAARDWQDGDWQDGDWPG